MGFIEKRFAWGYVDDDYHSKRPQDLDDRLLLGVVFNSNAGPIAVWVFLYKIALFRGTMHCPKPGRVLQTEVIFDEILNSRGEVN
jgi:hypothetical protein